MEEAGLRESRESQLIHVCSTAHLLRPMLTLETSSAIPNFGDILFWIRGSRGVGHGKSRRRECDFNYSRRFMSCLIVDLGFGRRHKTLRVYSRAGRVYYSHRGRQVD
jgi:hypothetical protein